jgi:hypothetical protein
MSDKKHNLSSQDWRLLSNYITDVINGRKRVVVISKDEEGTLIEVATGRKFESTMNKSLVNLHHEKIDNRLL